jgi:hypothetical protein
MPLRLAIALGLEVTMANGHVSWYPETLLNLYVAFKEEA